MNVPSRSIESYTLTHIWFALRPHRAQPIGNQMWSQITRTVVRMRKSIWTTHSGLAPFAAIPDRNRIRVSPLKSIRWNLQKNGRKNWSKKQTHKNGAADEQTTNMHNCVVQFTMGICGNVSGACDCVRMWINRIAPNGFAYAVTRSQSNSMANGIGFAIETNRKRRRRRRSNETTANNANNEDERKIDHKIKFLEITKNRQTEIPIRY